ncbi:ATP-dependent DNA ligase [Amycolatopsis antarctica]|uniref:DNA ligase (ATP) n=1 Tax=Amycolatopsis antarctica TaxID=1854586 RepID=A0A263D4H3_9PSEU|nr:non-homologous end-joining DNA ligase [Amycolatopsis antarctica]OZM73261.1 ATP-dependent DNA ligase [Amycolatopsis antarctica]
MSAPGWRDPMLATLTERRFADRAWLFERKLDGVRAICVRDGGTPQLLSRNRNPMNGAYPEIVEAIAGLGGDRFVVDGEIVAFDGERTSFATLAPRIHLTDPERARATGVDVYYYLFDLLHFDDHDARRLPLRQRKELLREAFDFTDPLRRSEHRDTDGDAYFRHACEQGWEGLIAKRADSPYHGGRTRDWLKFKCVSGQEFVVGGFTDPSGSRQGFGALLLGYYEGDSLRYAGKVGTGFDSATLHDLHDRLLRMEEKTSPFAERVAERGIHWVRPEIVAQIGFSEWTNDGRLRHSRFLGEREDKSPTEVVREEK